MLNGLDTKVLFSLYQTNMTSNKTNTHTRGNIFMKQHDLISDEWIGYSRRNPLLLLKYLDMSKENYYTVNAIQGHSLSSDKAQNVVGYNGLFADLDISGHQGKTDKSKIERVYKSIKALADNHQIIPYTYCVYTGHGLDLVWLFKYQVTDNSKNSLIRLKWQRLEDAILNELESNSKVGQYVDGRVHDPSRVIRFPGTNNVKYILPGSKDMCPLETKVLNYTGIKYDFWKLYHKLVTVPKVAKQSYSYEQSTNARFAMPLNYAALNLRHRLQSVEHLVRLREGQCNGYRNSILHIVASGLLYVFSRVRKYAISTQQEVKTYICNRVDYLNQSFSDPLPDSEIATLKHKVWISKFNTSSKSDDFAKYCYKKLSKSKRGGIINFLDITADEQWYLTYLRTPKIQRKYRNWVRKQQRQQQRALYVTSHKEEIKQAKVRRLHFIKHVMLYYKHSGKTQKEVAKHFGHKSGSWLANLIKRYKHIQLKHTYLNDRENYKYYKSVNAHNSILRLTG